MYDERDSGLHLGSMLIGLTVGVAATLLYATYQEKSFNRIVRRTREMSDQTEDFLTDLSSNVRDKASQLTGRMHSAVDELEDTAHDTIKKAKDLGKDVADRAQKAADHARNA